MKFSISILGALVITTGLMPLAFGQPNSTNEAQSSEYADAVQSFEHDAQGKSTYEIAQEISALKQSVRLKRKPNSSIFSNFDDPDSMKAIGYLNVLKKRRDDGDPEAALQFGIHELSICDAIQANAGRGLAQPVCSSAMDSLKLAAQAKDPRAMEALGVMNNEGLGQRASKYVAADWFIKASQQYDIEGNRERALQTLEEALKAVSDHPGALELRKKLLK